MAHWHRQVPAPPALGRLCQDEGRIEQIGTPAAIYDQPANPFVTEFISRVNILPSSSNIFQPKGLETTESQLLEPSSDLVTKQYLYTKM